MYKIILFSFFSIAAFAQKNWVGSSTNWNTASNWSPAGVPSATDEIVIDACTTCPVLTSSLTVDRITISNGSSLGIGSNTLTVNEILTLTGATINSAAGVLDVNRTGAYYGNTFNGNLTLRVNFLKPANRNAYLGAQTGGNTYNNDFTLEVETGDWTTYSIADAQADTYKGKTYLKNKGWGWFLVAKNATVNPTLFEQEVAFMNDNSNEGKFQIGFAGGKIRCIGTAQFTDISTSPYSYMSVGEATFEDAVTISANRSEISFAYSNHTIFKKNVTISNGNDAKFIFGSGGTSEFQSLSNLALNGSMNAGQFRFKDSNFLTSATPLTLQLGTGTTLATPTSKTLVRIGNDVTFSRPVDIKADYIEYNRATFNQATTLERTGPIIGSQAGFNGAGISPGWSTFNGTTVFKNTYADDWMLGAYNPDIFNGNVTFTHGNNTQNRLTVGYLRPALTGVNQFNGNIVLNVLSLNGNTQGGIEFGGNSGVSNLAATKTITTNTVDFGIVSLRGFRQLDATTNQTLNMPGGRLMFNVNVDGVGAKFASKLTATAGHIEISGSEFYQPTFIKKLNGEDLSNGSNTFFSKVNILNQAPNYGDIKFIIANSAVRN